MAHMRPHVLLGVTATELRSYVSLFCRLFPLLFTSFVPGLFFRSWDHGIFFFGMPTGGVGGQSVLPRAWVTI